MENQQPPFHKRINNFVAKRPVIKKILGGVLLSVGIFAMVTPLTPGATWLIILGLELLGFHILTWYRFRDHMAELWEKYKGIITRKRPQ